MRVRHRGFKRYLAGVIYRSLPLLHSSWQKFLRHRHRRHGLALPMGDGDCLRLQTYNRLGSCTAGPEPALLSVPERPRLTLAPGRIPGA